MGPENRDRKPESTGRTFLEHHVMRSEFFPPPLRTIVSNMQYAKYPGGLTKKELVKLNDAYDFAHTVHRGQKRENGARYVDHVLRVGVRVARYGGNLNQVIAGLLHDSIEQGVYEGGHVSHSLLQAKFGKRVANAVAAMSVGKITHSGKIIPPTDPDYHNVEHRDTLPNYWKRESDIMSRVLNHGVDALLPKICDQSDNMFTVGGMDQKKLPRYYQKCIGRVDLLTSALSKNMDSRGRIGRSARISAVLRSAIEGDLLDRFGRMKKILAQKLGPDELAQLERTHPLRSITSFSVRPSLPRRGRSR
ncbi:MAG: HD domain-containing protein [Candidatus Micrarchaeota archaeon]